MKLRLPQALHWRIALAYTALIFVTMGAVSLYLVDFVRDTYLANLQAGLEQQARLVSENAAHSFAGGAPDAAPDSAELQALSQRLGAVLGARATIADGDGAIIADSDLPLERLISGPPPGPEIRAALAGGVGRVVRADGRNGAEMLYIAAPIALNGSVVGAARVAVPTARTRADINRIIAAIAVSALLVAALSVGVGYFVFRGASRSVRAVADGANRLAQGDLEHRVATGASDETRDLADAFNAMASTIRRMVNDMSDERDKLAAMLDTMEDGVVVIEPDGRITLMNSAAELMLDVNAKTAVGGRLAEALRDHEIQQAAAHALATGQIRRVEAELLPQRRFLSAIATPLGRPGFGGILLTLHDLTGAHQLENTLREFVTNVSHELRSPLASVKAMVETLDEGALDDGAAARNFLRRINREVDRMNDMVEDLLELSRLESGQMPPNLAPFDLAAMAREAASEYAERAPAVAVRADIPDAPIMALGESGKLRQALVNLLENALRHTPSGEIVVSVSMDSGGGDDGDGAPSRCWVRVRDTGVGIAREHLPHVFERFYKADRSRADGGSGLGLAIARHIVESHGGEVRAESEEGVGSVFSFSAPAASRAGDDIDPVAG